MARLHEESDEELPDLQDIINQHAQKAWPQSQPPTRTKTCASRAKNRKPSKGDECSGLMQRDYYRDSFPAGRENDLRDLVTRIDRLECKAQSGLSQPLIHHAPLKVPQVKATELKSRRNCFPSAARMTPSRSAKKNISYNDPQLSPTSVQGTDEDFINESSTYSDDEWKTGIIENSDDVFGSPVPVRKIVRQREPIVSRNCQEAHSIAIRKQSHPLEDTSPPPRGQNKTKRTPRLDSSEIHSETAADVNIDAFLKFSPPHAPSPRKTQKSHRPSTPPCQRPCTPPLCSPAKNPLTSPSKRQAHMSAPPHRPSLDSFWDQEMVNEWTEQHSPRKILHSPSKSRFFDTLREISADDGDESYLNLPTSSPKKNRIRSPKKTDVEKRAAGDRKTFESEKHGIASKFLKELDDKITDGKIGQMANDGSGVRLEWNRKLNSTAGRAHWKREGRRKDPIIREEKEEIKFRHEARIELAEKVIDCEERLINVIAHEYCHLACFMISGIRDNPHGKEFKAWARKCTLAFAHRNIEVTTKHSYVIDYKYVWACTSCGNEYKRHSKSIDISRHACGSCRAKLIQIKPVPRGTKGPSEYQEFVKKVFKDVKQKNPAIKHGEIMEIIGRMYRESKAARTDGDGKIDKSTETKFDGLAKEMEVLIIEDD